jgi:hypothetical protein
LQNERQWKGNQPDDAQEHRKIEAPSVAKEESEHRGEPTKGRQDERPGDDHERQQLAAKVQFSRVSLRAYANRKVEQ